VSEGLFRGPSFRGKQRGKAERKGRRKLAENHLGRIVGERSGMGLQEKNGVGRRGHESWVRLVESTKRQEIKLLSKGKGAKEPLLKSAQEASIYGQEVYRKE